MAAGFGSPLWLLGLGKPQVAKGFNSALFPLGLSQPPAVASTTGYRGLLALWAGGAGVGEAAPPEPPVITPGAGGGRFIPSRFPGTQYARLHPFEDHDLFGRLIARAGLARAYLRPYAEDELYGRLRAAAIAYAAIKPIDHGDEYAQVVAQRGLPSKALLAFLISELYKH